MAGFSSSTYAILYSKLKSVATGVKSVTNDPTNPNNIIFTLHDNSKITITLSNPIIFVDKYSSLSTTGKDKYLYVCKEDDGDNKKGESKLAGKQFFDTDKNFNLAEFFHFCSKMVKPEPKGVKEAGCMIVFCEFEQQFILIEEAKKHGFMHYIPLQFYKNYSAQVLKANMKVVGNTEYALLFYRDKLPKFRNNGRMIFNCMPYE